jgi:hypothetical protein
MQGIKSFLKEVLADRQGNNLLFTSIRNKTRTHVPFLVANVLKTLFLSCKFFSALYNIDQFNDTDFFP